MIYQLAEATAENIRIHLREASMTQKYLSWETGIPYVTLNRKLRGKQDFSLSEVYMIAKALKIEVSALIAPVVENKASKEAA